MASLQWRVWIWAVLRKVSASDLRVQSKGAVWPLTKLHQILHLKLRPADGSNVMLLILINPTAYQHQIHMLYTVDYVELSPPSWQ